MEKLLKIMINYIYKLKCKIEERKQLSLTKNNQRKLTNEEKKNINKKFIRICKIIKPIYGDWDNCEYKYFISNDFYQIKLLPKLNDVNYNEVGIRHKMSYFMDKNFQEKFATEVQFPKVILRKINGDYYDEKFNYISPNSVLDVLSSHEKVVFKKSY